MGTRSLPFTNGPPIREAVGLGVVDVALLAGFVTYGHLHHGGDPLADPAGTVEAVAPFLLGWIVASALAGVYRRAIARDPIRIARLSALCWLAAANVGLLLRNSPYLDGGTAYPFPLVMTGVGLLVLLPWRIGYAAAVGNRA